MENPYIHSPCQSPVFGDSLADGLMTMSGISGHLFPLFLSALAVQQVSMGVYKCWKAHSARSATNNITATIFPNMQNDGIKVGADFSLSNLDAQTLSTVISSAAFAHKLDLNPTEPELAYEQVFGKPPSDNDLKAVETAYQASRNGDDPFQTFMTLRFEAEFMKANDRPPKKSELLQIVELSSQLATDYIDEAKKAQQRQSGVSKYGVRNEDLSEGAEKLITDMERDKKEDSVELKKLRALSAELCQRVAIERKEDANAERSPDNKFGVSQADLSNAGAQYNNTTEAAELSQQQANEIEHLLANLRGHSTETKKDSRKR